MSVNISTDIEIKLIVLTVSCFKLKQMFIELVWKCFGHTNAREIT